MSLKVPVPVEFLQELNELLRSLIALRETGNLTPQAGDAAGKVISWIPHFHPIASAKFKEEEKKP